MNERSDRDKAFGDAVYETWRRGGNSDLVSRENIDHYYYNGAETWEGAAHQEAARIMRTAEQRRQEREQAEYERHLEYERYCAEHQEEMTCGTQSEVR